MATFVNGWVVGVGNVVVVLDVVVVVVVLDVVVVVVVVLADFLADSFTRNTMPMMAAAMITAPTARRVLRRRFRPFSMTACFCSRAARCRALFSVGTEQKATEPAGQVASACRSWVSGLRPGPPRTGPSDQTRPRTSRSLPSAGRWSPAHLARR
jgi:hypothetical protein